MKKKTFAHLSFISLLSISVLFTLSSKVSALSYRIFDNTHIFKWSYEKLADQLPDIASHIDISNWPNQIDVDIESENGDPLPYSSDASFLILKYGRNSWAFWDGVPTSWGELSKYGVNGISTYQVPEQSSLIFLGLFLLFIITIQRNKFKKSLK